MVACRVVEAYAVTYFLAKLDAHFVSNPSGNTHSCNPPGLGAGNLEPCAELLDDILWQLSCLAASCLAGED